MVGIAEQVTDVVVKKKSYHHGDLRNAIIIAATARARAEGERAIVLREIAGQIGVSATAAYRHFTNRRQLVEEVAARGFIAMREYVDRPSVGAAVSDPGLAAYIDLRNMCLALVRFAGVEPAWARMMIETLGESPLVEDAAREVRVLLQSIVDRGVEAGMFEPGTDLQRNRVFWAAIDGPSSHAMFGIYPNDQAESDRVTARMVDLSVTDILTEHGAALLDDAALPPGIVTGTEVR